MILSIISINRNNSTGLVRTLGSVRQQDTIDFEHIIIDGASTDGSVEIIRQYADSAQYPVKWVSEPDGGIYNAMNKGIRMASGDYIHILNSGDYLAGKDVVGTMIEKLTKYSFPDILYGNMIKESPDGNVIGKSGPFDPAFLSFYHGTLNHNCAYIKKMLFEKYGYYDEELKIVSDWKWYMQAIGLGNVAPQYVNVDVSRFVSDGISETNPDLRLRERRQILEQVVPHSILADYDRHSFEISQVNRLKRHNMYLPVHLLERFLFKLEKWHIFR